MPDGAHSGEDAARDWLLRLASGDLTEAELAAFHAWHDADPRHRAAFAEARALWNDLGPLEPAFAAPDEVPWLPGGASRGHPGRWAVLAALVAACVAVVYATDLPTMLRADHRTGIGGQTRVTLPDGSIALLNTDSAITVDYSGRDRSVSLLKGEVLFEVSPNPKRPFTVQAGGGRVTAVGTAFTVREERRQVAVAVAEGAVRIDAGSAEPPWLEGHPAATRSRPVLLSSGNWTAFRDGQVSPAQAIRPDAVAAWRTGAVVIDNLPVAQAIAELARYWPGKVLVLANTARLAPVSARIALTGVEGGIRAIASTHKLKVTRMTDYLLVVRDE